MEITVDVTDQEVDSLTQSILVRYGIDFTGYEPKSLKRRIVRALYVFQFESIHHLWARMLHERTFIYSFMDEISVGMTSMFRDPIFWKHLKRLMQNNFSDSSEFKVWHAGCSTGEEVYSLDILLKELNLLNKVKTLATDINQSALKEAQAGRYHKIKMIENERNFREYNCYADFQKYFIKCEDDKHVVMNPELITSATFTYHNLINDPVPDKFDIILCRNVMIYFDFATKCTLLEKFYSALKPGGYFMIGYYDTMLPIINQHKLELVDEEAKIFRKT